MANTENIVTFLKRKNATGFDTPFFIGSSAKRISGIRGINLNNIEENMLFGFDSITTEEEVSEGVTHIKKEFRDEERETEYYYIDTYIFENASGDRRHFFRDILYLPDDKNDNIFEDESLVTLNANVYSFVNDTFSMTNIEAPTTPIITEDTLHFINENGDDIAIAKKVTYAKTTVGGKKIQKQIIKNLLLED